MATAKILITIDEDTLHRLDRLVKERVFPNRSKAIQDAVEEKLRKLERNRLAMECAKLDPAVEQGMAEEGLGEELKHEKEEWHQIAANGLTAVHDDVEPEYSDQSIKQRNPEFRH